MSPLFAFVGLLLLSYLGSILVGKRGVRGYGLPSGSEYLLLGMVVGPLGLRSLDVGTLLGFAPLLHAGAGWLLLLTGLDWAARGSAAPRPLPTLVASLLGVITLASVAAAVWFAALHFTDLGSHDRLLLSLATAAVAIETTGIAVRWVFERHGADGPLTRTIRLLTDADDVPALLLAGWVFCMLPRPAGSLALPAVGWFGITLGLGLLLGLAAVTLMGRTFHAGEARSYVLGAALLGIGITVHLGLSTGATLFVLGATISALSRHRGELRQLLHPTEQPILLPVLVLAGALVDWTSHPALYIVVLAALGGRLGGKLVTGFIVWLSPRGRPAGPLLGLGLTPSGAVSLSLALTLALGIRSVVGELVLATAAACALFGELIGPYSLRRALGRAGEVREPDSPRDLGEGAPWSQSARPENPSEAPTSGAGSAA